MWWAESLPLETCRENQLLILGLNFRLKTDRLPRHTRDKHRGAVREKSRRRCNSELRTTLKASPDDPNRSDHSPAIAAAGSAHRGRYRYHRCL